MTDKTTQHLTDSSTDRDEQKKKKLCDDFKIDVFLQLAPLGSEPCVVEKSLRVVACKRFATQKMTELSQTQSLS